MRRPPLRDSLTDPAGIASGAAVETWPAFLIVDDDDNMRHALVCYFERRGRHVAAAANLDEAKTLFRTRKAWTLVLSDYHLPDGTGIELSEWIRAQAGSTPAFLLMSGSLQGGELNTCLDFLAKPFPLAELESRVQLLLRPRQS